MPEHENFESIIREWENPGDEAVPQDVREAMEYAQFLTAAIVKVEQRTGRTRMTAKAKQAVIMAAKMIAVHHAIGGREE